LEQITDRFPRLGSREGWSARFGRELNVTDDGHAFGARGLAVIEGKHVTPFGVELSSARFRIDAAIAAQLLPARPFAKARLAYRDVSGVGNRLSLIAAIVPAGVVTTHTLFCLRNDVSLEQQHFLCAMLNGYVLNALARMLMSGHLTTSLVEGLPAPVWMNSASQRRVAREYGLDAKTFARVLEGFPLVPASDRARALAIFQASTPPEL